MITGLHHVTALCASAQGNFDFYAGILGLRLIKKTINFDEPEVYHLYYGDETGSPGAILTFFLYPGMQQGKKGKGQLTITSFSIPEKSLEYWIARLKRFNIPFTVKRRFDENRLSFNDFEGLGLELVATAHDTRTGIIKGPVPEEHSIKGFHGITLSEKSYQKTASLLVEQLDHQFLSEEGNCFRFATYPAPGHFVDILCCPDELKGIAGAGTVHHVAFATTNEQTQLQTRAKLEEKGLHVTQVIDRQYFHSIYFREPGGVLFEVATLGPGFAVDEPIDLLGSSLKLPPWEEKNRPFIEQKLPTFIQDLKRFED